MRTTIKLCTVALAVAAPAVQAQAERFFGLTSGNAIVTFDSSAPGVTTSSGTIAGLGGDTLTGLDLRPANRTLYSVGTSGNLYAISKNARGVNYTATSLGVITGATPTGSSFGIDFNPTVDRLRLTSDTNQNLRINPNVMPPAAIVDGAITLNSSSLVDLVAVAYRNSRPGATTTVLYGLDAVSDSLVRATNANAGTYVGTNVLGAAFGALGFSFAATDRVAFDISGGSNNGFFTINDGFYGVNQITGAGTFLGNLGTPGVTGIAAGAVPEPAAWALMITGFGLVGGAMRRRNTGATVAA